MPTKPKNAFYAQSGGVTAVINASAAGVIETEGAQAHPVQAIPGRTFHSVDQVLRWAYETEQYRGAKVANYAPCVAASTGGDKLSNLDRLAQSACIRARVDRLPDEQRELVRALYAWDMNAQQSIDGLCARSRKAIELGPTALVEALVVRHCRQVRRLGSEPLKLLAALHATPYITVRRRDEPVRDWLGRLWLDAETRLYKDWARTGLIAL